MTSMRKPPRKIVTFSTPPSTITAIATASTNGRKLGPGTWTPGGGACRTAGRTTDPARASYSRLDSRPQ